jgi:hypothetical protein
MCAERRRLHLVLIHASVKALLIDTEKSGTFVTPGMPDLVPGAPQGNGEGKIIVPERCLAAF